VDATIGQTGVPGSDNAHLGSPAGLGTDADGWLYVADSNSGTFQRIQVFDANGSWLATIGGSAGTGDYQFWQIGGIFVSPSKDILVADSGNHRVQAYRHAGGQNWSLNFTVGVSGQAGSDNGHLSSPADVTADGSGKLFIADYGNSRVQVFSGPSFLSTLGVTGTPRPDNSHLGMPSGVAASPQGSLFVSDIVPSTQFNSRVVVFDASLRRVCNIGDRHWTGLVDPGSSYSALWLPSGVAPCANGSIFVSDTSNQRVVLFGPLGGLQATLGATGVSGNDSSHFFCPRGGL